MSPHCVTLGMSTAEELLLLEGHPVRSAVQRHLQAEENMGGRQQVGTFRLTQAHRFGHDLPLEDLQEYSIKADQSKFWSKSFNNEDPWKGKMTETSVMFIQGERDHFGEPLWDVP